MAELVVNAPCVVTALIVVVEITNTIPSLE